MQENKWERKENWVGAQIDDSYVMLNFEGGEYVSLNSTATDIWDALESPCRLSDIVNKLTARYEISENDCAASVNRVLVDLENKGLIKPSA